MQVIDRVKKNSNAKQHGLHIHGLHGNHSLREIKFCQDVKEWVESKSQCFPKL